MKSLHSLSFAAALVVVAAGCSGETAKDATAAVVGKGIEVSKGAVTGIAAGVEQGRKNAESADGAHIVSSDAELKLSGGAKLGEVVADGEGARVDILVENTADKPLRATKLDVIVLDKDGVVAASTLTSMELTVPAKAKAKLSVTTTLKPEKVGTVRLYGQDLAR